MGFVVTTISLLHAGQCVCYREKVLPLRKLQSLCEDSTPLINLCGVICFLMTWFCAFLVFKPHDFSFGRRSYFLCHE